MKSVCLTIAALMVLATASLSRAEPPAGPAGAQTPPPPRRPAGNARMNPSLLLPEMVSELKLDDQQQNEVKRLFAEHEEATRKLSTQLVQPPEMIAKSKEIRMAIRTNKQANNQAEITRLTEELRALREDYAKKTEPIRKELQESRDQLHTQVAAVLRPDQKQQFDTLWEDHMNRPMGYPGAVGMRSPQNLRNLIMKLSDLTSEQRKAVDEQFKAYRDASKPGSGKPGSNAVAAAKAFTDGVMNLLTPEQRTKIETQLAPRHPNKPNDNSKKPPL